MVSASAGETNEASVTSSLLVGDEAAGDVVVDTLPEKVALDWHNISCSIYKVQHDLDWSILCSNLLSCYPSCCCVKTAMKYFPLNFL